MFPKFFQMCCLHKYKLILKNFKINLKVVKTEVSVCVYVFVCVCVCLRQIGWWCLERTASKHVYYLGWDRPPAQVGCMRQVLRPGALGRLRGIGWRGRWEGGSRWRTHVNPWLIHVNVWQNPLQYCKVITLQLIKINEKKKEIKDIHVYMYICVYTHT